MNIMKTEKQKNKNTGSYNLPHMESDCDRCLKRVGKENLNRVPYLYTNGI